MDFMTDQSRRYLLALSEMAPAPDYVKTASVLPESVSGLQDCSFADPVAREYPMNTAANIWMGFGYGHLTGAPITILDRLKRAGQMLNITHDLDALEAALTAQVKSASAEQHHYAVEVDFGNREDNSKRASISGIRGFYPLNTADQVRMSAIKLANDKDRLPLVLFVEGSANLLKRAEALQVSLSDIPPVVRRYGEDRLPAMWLVKQAAEQRHQCTQDDFYLNLYDAMEADISQRPMHAWADLWEQADLLNGYQKKAEELDVFQLLTAGSTRAEEHAELDKWALLSNSPVPVSAVAKVAEAQVRKHFPAATADRLLEGVKAAKESAGTTVTAFFDEMAPEIVKHFLRHCVLAA